MTLTHRGQKQVLTKNQKMFWAVSWILKMSRYSLKSKSARETPLKSLAASLWTVISLNKRQNKNTAPRTLRPTPQWEGTHTEYFNDNMCFFLLNSSAKFRILRTLLIVTKISSLNDYSYFCKREVKMSPPLEVFREMIVFRSMRG